MGWDAMRGRHYMHYNWRHDARLRELSRRWNILRATQGTCRAMPERPPFFLTGLHICLSLVVLPWSCPLFSNCDPHLETSGSGPKKASDSKRKAMMFEGRFFEE